MHLSQVLDDATLVKFSPATHNLYVVITRYRCIMEKHAELNNMARGGTNTSAAVAAGGEYRNICHGDWSEIDPTHFILRALIFDPYLPFLVLSDVEGG